MYPETVPTKAPTKRTHKTPTRRFRPAFKQGRPRTLSGKPSESVQGIPQKIPRSRPGTAQAVSTHRARAGVQGVYPEKIRPGARPGAFSGRFTSGRGFFPFAHYPSGKPCLAAPFGGHLRPALRRGLALPASPVRPDERPIACTIEHFSLTFSFLKSEGLLKNQKKK